MQQEARNKNLISGTELGQGKVIGFAEDDKFLLVGEYLTTKGAKFLVSNKADA